MEGYPKRKRGDPTWSATRDDAYAQKERPAGEPHRLCTLHNLRDAARRDETIAIVCAVNPSVSLTAASSPYTGEPLGWYGATPFTQGRLGVGALPICYPLHRGAMGCGRLFFLPAEAAGQAGLDGLFGAGDEHGVLGDIPGDGGPRGDVAAGADLRKRPDGDILLQGGLGDVGVFDDAVFADDGIGEDTAGAGAFVIFLMSLEMILDIEIFKNQGPIKEATLVPLVFPLLEYLSEPIFRQVLPF